MKLSKLLELVEDKELFEFKDLDIYGLKIDSRKVVEGDIFVCLKGRNFDGHFFVSEALKKGAKAIISEHYLDLCENVPLVVVSSSKKAYSLIAQSFYSIPSKKLKLIGITGTTGKTSVAYLTYKALNIIGEKASLVGTAGYYSLNNRLDLMLAGPVTTPEPMELNYLFKKFLEDGIKYVVLEASSFGLEEERLFGLEFDVALLTNISYNHHVNYHSSFENYILSKTKLFEQTKRNGTSILNKDCKYYDKFLNSSHNILTYGANINADINIGKIDEIDKEGVYFNLSYKGNKYLVKSSLSGNYNALNIASAFGVGISLGFDEEKFIDALSTIDKIPGRWDKIKSNYPAAIVIDKANTPIAIKSISTLIRNKEYKHKIVVFGNVGGGDKEERVIIAKLLSNLFDLIILTIDDPENEDPQVGFSDFLEGLNKEDRKKCIIEVDRKEAISKAMSYATNTGDLLVILGRGNQREFLVRGKALDFDDTVETRKILISKGYAVYN